MLELVKGSILNPIQVAGEVNAALKENAVVVAVKRDGIYAIYAGPCITTEADIRAWAQHILDNSSRKFLPGEKSCDCYPCGLVGG